MRKRGWRKNKKQNREKMEVRMERKKAPYINFRNVHHVHINMAK